MTTNSLNCLINRWNVKTRWWNKKKFQGIENREKDEESKPTALPKWLLSKNDFKEAIKLIEDITADTNNAKSSSGDKRVFNDLDKLINDIKNKKTTKESTIKKIKNIVFDLDQQRQKESTVFHNKVIDCLLFI